MRGTRNAGWVYASAGRPRRGHVTEPLSPTERLGVLPSSKPSSWTALVPHPWVILTDEGVVEYTYLRAWFHLLRVRLVRVSDQMILQL